MNPLQVLFDKFVGVYKRDAAAARVELATAVGNLVQSQERIQSLEKQLEAASRKVVTVPIAPPDPSRPLVTLVERSAEFVEAAFRRNIGVTGPNGHLLFNYRNMTKNEVGGMLRYPLDATYNLPTTLEDLRVAINWGRSLDKRHWVADKYDCDNRARHLSAMLGYHLDMELGMVIDGHASHVFNLAMLADGSIFVVEPEDSPPTVYALNDIRRSYRYPLLVGTFWF